MNKRNKNKKTINLVKFKFLPDIALTADQERLVRFGHNSIAENLKQIILNCPTPFTIGLFGKWGTGKTTIINILKKKLQRTKIACVIFDVWKHEDDALRRTFLKEITKQLKKGKYLPNNFELSERLDKNILREFQGKLRLNKSMKKYLFILGGLIVVIASLFLMFWPQSLSTYLSIVFGGSVTATIIACLFQQVLTTETITSVTDRFKDPHEFETEFKNLFNNNSLETLLLIIDNLDRTSHEKAIELLATIKTFLEQKRCIFLIACDDEAIKKHLESVYLKGVESSMKKTPFDTDEFLRKFFNTSQKIPDFIDTELQTYTEDLLKEIQVPQFTSSDVASVITSAFRENPRQIKQFINTLLTHFLLAKVRENNNNSLIVPKGAVTNEVAPLAKFLIIHHQFPDIYNIIIERNLSFPEIEKFNFKGVQEEQVKKFQDFLKATSWINVDNIQLLHYFKQSKEELSIPVINEVKIALIDNKEDIVKEQIGKLDSKQMKSFEKIVISLIDRYKTNRIYSGNIISSCLIGLKHIKKEFTSRFYNKIAGLLNDDKSLGTDLHRFEPSLIFDEILSRCNSSDRKYIIDRYIKLLSKPKESQETK